MVSISGSSTASTLAGTQTLGRGERGAEWCAGSLQQEADGQAWASASEDFLEEVAFEARLEERERMVSRQQTTHKGAETGSGRTACLGLDVLPVAVPGLGVGTVGQARPWQTQQPRALAENQRQL